MSARLRLTRRRFPERLRIAPLVATAGGLTLFGLGFLKHTDRHLSDAWWRLPVLVFVIFVLVLVWPWRNDFE